MVYRQCHGRLKTGKLLNERLVEVKMSKTKFAALFPFFLHFAQAGKAAKGEDGLMGITFNAQRDYVKMKVYAAFCAGIAPRKIAKEFGISRQRVHDIIRIMREELAES